MKSAHTLRMEIRNDEARLEHYAQWIDSTPPEEGLALKLAPRINELMHRLPVKRAVLEQLLNPAAHANAQQSATSPFVTSGVAQPVQPFHG